jgi:hypothetical protein
VIKHVVDFYKTLFGEEHRDCIRLGVELWEEDEKVNDEENEALEAEFSEEEIQKDVFESYSEGSPSPDEFSFLFYQKFWSIIKMDLMTLVRGFE